MERLNIILAEPSPLLQEGLRAFFQKSAIRADITDASYLSQVEQLLNNGDFDAVFINPSLLTNSPDGFASLRNAHNPVRWVGIVYAYFDQDILVLFDGLIRISDTQEKVTSLLKHLLHDNQQDDQELHQNLSDREVDVLKLLVAGCSNKEIAEKLYISVHTVISHRKNISVKTGIKSVAGLTIYAVAKKIIRLEQLES